MLLLLSHCSFPISHSQRFALRQSQQHDRYRLLVIGYSFTTCSVPFQHHSGESKSGSQETTTTATRLIMPRPFVFPRRTSINSLQSAAMSTSSRNMSPPGRTSEDKKRKKLSVTCEEDGSKDENNVRRHYCSNSEDDAQPDNTPHFLITPATLPPPGSELEPEAHTPNRTALLNNPLYQHIRQSVIDDIITHLRDTQHHNTLSPTLSNVAYRSMPTALSDIGSSVLDPYAEAYLQDPQFYNPRFRRSRVSSQVPLNHMSPTPSQLRLSLLGSNPSVYRFNPTSPHMRPRDLSAINEASGEGVSKMQLQPVEHVAPITDSSDVSNIENIGERPYIPELKWEDRYKWPAFIRTWPAFIWCCVHDSFSTNPYKLHPAIYIAMGFCLVWCIVTKWALIIVGICDVINQPWTPEAKREARRLTDSMVSILPYVVQLVLFLFPPLLASSS
ncbi:hypothetical protein K458DRAFT_28879 [Lentithecium fluviatile CBS 122367]|uniref:Uncharacterized protein n=1 Tax=Lentithecium fluviatile CBS 122367 TaxID=1168545 RepID=A0A6G1J3Y4_9PLEO|nr:hypothetical protein K458DRAFT_28879 [Lentithecium fluviatile CBS 122367]